MSGRESVIARKGKAPLFTWRGNILPGLCWRNFDLIEKQEKNGNIRDCANWPQAQIRLTYAGLAGRRAVFPADEANEGEQEGT